MAKQITKNTELGMGKVLTPDDITQVKVMSNEEIAADIANAGRSEESLSQMRMTADGKMVEVRDIGQSVFERDEDGKTVKFFLKHGGWGFFPVSHANTKNISVMPEMEIRPAVLHEKNADASDPHNKAEGVFIPRHILAFLATYGTKGTVIDKISTQDGFDEGALQNFMRAVLVKNGFDENDIPQKNKLHSALELAAILLISPEKMAGKGLTNFVSVPAFTQARQEDMTPDKELHDGL